MQVRDGQVQTTRNFTKVFFLFFFLPSLKIEWLFPPSVNNVHQMTTQRHYSRIRALRGAEAAIFLLLGDK